MSRPLLSVVIPSFNSEKYIGDCLESLKKEASDRVELILMDGGSSDRTMELVEAYRDMFEIVISAADKGQSDAFNKGFALARGEYFTWLNSDDVFCPGALDRVLDEIALTKQPWYAANVVYIDKDSKVTRCCRSGAFEGFALNFGVLNVFGPSTIFHRDLYAELGGFREDFHFCMDTEYWWRIAGHGIRYQRLPVYLWALRLHEDAKTAASVKGGEDARPPGMRLDNERNREMYFPQVSRFKRRLGVLLVRCYRILNLSYLKSILSTYRYRGVRLDKVKSIR
jgi:glycosyltransferase involved in cell wall biosynthesis